MKSFNWLHLTDLHFGLKGQESLWPNVREVFWNDLKTLHEKSGPWDAVLFTGDLVQSGTEAEFTELEEKVLGPLWAHLDTLGTKDPILLAVPGNHDLVRPESKKPKAALRLLLQENSFNEIGDEFWSEPECEYRKIVSAAFENYQAWSSKNNRTNGVTITPGCLPGDFAASINVQSAGNEHLKIGIAGVNTTFLQLTNGDYIRRLTMDSKQLHQACGEDLPAWTEAHDACILMTHQGPAWLNKITGTAAYEEINPAGRFAVHLFGHMHETALRSSASGGGKIVRQWQGNSLFGLEKFGEPPQTDRRHGYGAGRIEFGGEGATISHWPRRAIKDANGNGWRFSPDHDSCVLDEANSCTIPEHLVDRTGNSKPVEVTQVGGSENHKRFLKEMELQLQHALEAFKGQPTVFLEPKLSKTREFNNEANELVALKEKPRDTRIVAPPEFGLTCLGLHLQLEGFRKGELWLYIDAEQTKGRKIAVLLEKELVHYDQKIEGLKCIIIDGWNAANLDHLSMINNVISKCPEVPIIILAEDSLIPGVENLTQLKRGFPLLHLQALSKSAMRKLVSGYNEAEALGTEDVVLSRLAGHLESINIHRTPLNCYTLLRVLDSNYNEKLLNKSKLLKAILFVLFTDSESFSFLADRPEVDECTYVLGMFCKDLVKQGTRYFDSATIAPLLRETCKSKSIVLNVDSMLELLLENNILVEEGNQMAFRHRYWIFYFAAEWMQHDDDFRRFILTERNYVNYPEIIEFYTGIDGMRKDAMETLLSDLNSLINEVDKNVGIDRSFEVV
jgi:hypothetical protein